MITSFEVGAIFKIINEASPAIKTILRQVRELQVAIDKAKESLALIAKPAAMGSAITETGNLAKTWGDVAKNATMARAAIGSATRVSAQALAAPGAARTFPGGGRQMLGQRVHGGGGMHVYGPGVGLPGGSHVRLGGNVGGVAAGAAGLVGYGAYEAAQMEDAVFQLMYHSGQQYNDANRKRFHDILSESVRTSGFSVHDISEAAKQEIRMFQGTPGGGIDVLPEMLRAATVEARLKGESPEESMKALVGLAHMTKEYNPEQIKKLAPAFAFLSTANPGSLGSIERAAGYAVPMLQSGLDVDPMQALLFGTALTRAGATSTKSGTWLRQMALRALPSSPLVSEHQQEQHKQALEDFGLVDKSGKPTWFTNGKPDLFKMMDIAREHAAAIPAERRGPDEMALFGAQGGGGFALLSDPAVRQQIDALNKEMNSPEFKNRYGSFVQAYQDNATLQQARTAIGDFNMTMADLGAHTLPSVNHALTDFKSLLDLVRNAIPGAGRADSTTGARVLEGAAAGAATGAVVGALGGPIGAVGGAALGGVAGVAASYMEQQAKEIQERIKNGERPYDRPGDLYERRIEKLRESQKQVPPKIQLNLNIDGRSLAQAISEQQAAVAQYETGTPAYDGSQVYGP